MPQAADPFYERKRIPDEFIEGVGETGLAPGEEAVNRERKYSREGGDIRHHFWNPKGKDGKLDPYYQRKPVPEAMIHGVGDTGLTKEEEYLNRERKYSVNGTDLRKFSDSTKGGWHPTDDPYYGRKPVDKHQIDGVGDTQMSAAEAYEQRDNKIAFADFSSDPFQELTGRGHRQSVSGMAGPAAAAHARRRSSAVAPDAVAAVEHHHSGYDGDKGLAPIQSRGDDEITPVTSGASDYRTTSGAPQIGRVEPTTTTTTTSTDIGDNTGHDMEEAGHTTFYDAATGDLDDIAPNQRV